MTNGIGDYSDLAEQQKIGLVLEASTLDVDQYPDEDLDKIIAFARNSANNRDDVKKQCQEVAYSFLHWEPAVRKWILGYKDR